MIGTLKSRVDALTSTMARNTVYKSPALLLLVLHLKAPLDVPRLTKVWH